jgi:hypothetical protein
MALDSSTLPGGNHKDETVGRVILAVIAVSVICYVAAASAASMASARLHAEQRQTLMRYTTKVQNNALRYLHTTWFTSTYVYQSATVTSSVESTPSAPATESVEVLAPEGGFVGPSGAELPTRSQASALYATALALRTNTLDPSQVGVSRAEALRRTVAWANGLAISYGRDTWARGWQSPLWVYYLSSGAHQVWGSVPPPTKKLIDAAVASEADRLLGTPPPFFRSPAGAMLYKGDSKSEENGWNGTFLLMASVQYPRHPHAAAWEKQARAYLLTANATPQQIGADPRILGSNLNADGTVTNHGTVNPDYMFATAEAALRCDLICSQRPLSVPESHNNLQYVWYGLTVLEFTAGRGYQPPGGTIYGYTAKGRPTADIYYPQRPDWSAERRFNAAEMDVEIWASTDDPLAYEFAKVHLGQTMTQQARHPDGHTFATGESTFPEDEQFVAASSAEMVARIRAMR